MVEISTTLAYPLKSLKSLVNASLGVSASALKLRKRAISTKRWCKDTNRTSMYDKKTQSINARKINLKRTPLQKRLIDEKLQSMPRRSCFASNHIMVNRERVICGIDPLTRLSSLDEMARHHASLMSEEDRIFNIDVSTVDLSSLVENELVHTTKIKNERRSAEPPQCTEFAQNVSSGESIDIIHHKFMNSKKARSNIYDSSFRFFGLGSSRGSDGKLYICQIFCGVEAQT